MMIHVELERRFRSFNTKEFRRKIVAKDEILYRKNMLEKVERAG